LDSFEKIGRIWGKIIHTEIEDNKGLLKFNGWVDILTTKHEWIRESIKVRINNRIFVVRVSKRARDFLELGVIIDENSAFDSSSSEDERSWREVEDDEGASIPGTMGNSPSLENATVEVPMGDAGVFGRSPEKASSWGIETTARNTTQPREPKSSGKSSRQAFETHAYRKNEESWGNKDGSQAGVDPIQPGMQDGLRPNSIEDLASNPANKINVGLNSQFVPRPSRLQEGEENHVIASPSLSDEIVGSEAESGATSLVEESDMESATEEAG